MRVLITGAQGFIGRWLCGRWLQADSDVAITGLGRSAASTTFTHCVTGPGRPQPAPLPAVLADALRDPRYRYEAVDLFDGPALVGLLQRVRPDVVVHLAARLHAADALDVLRTNVMGTARLFEGLAGANLRPYVLLGSSAAAWGAQPEVPWHPSTPLGPATSAYAASRQSAEAVAQAAAHRHGITLGIARIFNPIGPGLQETHLPARLAAQITAHGRVESGPLEAIRDYIDVRDVADALRQLAQSHATGIHAVGSGRGVRCQAVFDAFQASLPEPIEHRVRGTVDHSRAVAGSPCPAPTSLAQSAADMLAYYQNLKAIGAPSPAQEAPPLRVDVQPRWGYDVEVEAGLRHTLPARLATRFPGASMVVLTDDCVHGLYGQAVVDAMRAAGIDTGLIVLPEGEPSKAYVPWRDVIEQMHQAGFARRSVLVCLGGGLVTDVGGFVAATYMRGVAYVNVPTTLLAQHDAAVGGKVAINTPWAKNFVGAFHHPTAVYCDPEVLSTLARRDISSGVAEALKVALTGDLALFELLEDKATQIMEQRDPEALAAVVRRSIRRKIDLLDPDPYEVDLRRVLNLGHTVAHPLETEFEYEGLRHGEAVGFGLAVAVEVARQRGVCSSADAERIHAVLARYALPPRLPPARCRAALGHLEAIRMVRGGHLHFVMPTAVDAVQIVPDVGFDALVDAVDAVLARQAARAA